MFAVYVTHPIFAHAGKLPPEVIRDSLESAIDYALQRTIRIQKECSIWIETRDGEHLAILN